MKNRSSSVAAAIGLVSFGLAAGGLAGPTVVSVDVIIAEGDVPAGGGGGAVTTINPAFVDSAGHPGFVGAVDAGPRFVWYDTGITFLSSDIVKHVLTGGESTMGVSDAGDFIYSPSIDGDDGVWTNNGLLLVETMPAPGIADQFISFCSRPQMTANAVATWVSGITATKGGSSQGRVLYRSTGGGTGPIEIVLATGDLVSTGEEEYPIDVPSGVDFDYDFSDDAAHHIQALTLDTGSAANDGAVWVDGLVIAQEGGPTPDGDVWANFDVVSINASGDYLFSGDTAGAVATDEFIAYNGVIGVREGDVVDGFTLGTGVRAAALNNLGRAAFIWGSGTNDPEGVLVGDAANLCGSNVVIQVGDLIDVDGDESGDFTVVDLPASSIAGPTIQFADVNFVYVELDVVLVEGGPEIEILVRVPVPCRGDLSGDGGVGPDDLAGLLADWGDSPCSSADFNGDGIVGPDDLATLLAGWGDCG